MEQNQVYEPREDSFLILKHIKEYANGSVLDIGTGTGILAIEASKYADSVIAVDINPKAIKHAKKSKKRIKNIIVKYSDLFERVHSRFDLIIFNPPYLPKDRRYPDSALDGGKHGYEIIVEFLNKANEHLKENGKILIVFSSLTKKEKIDSIIEKNMLCSKLIDSQKLDFEELYVYLIEKSSLLKELEKRGVTNIQYFTKGHRGCIHTGFYKNKKIAIKSRNPKSAAIARMEIEAGFLKKLNKLNIGPILLFGGNGYFAYTFIPGTTILEFFKQNDKASIITVIKKAFYLMYKLDKMGISKEEMHRPVKHLLIDDSMNVEVIDFERAHFEQKPANVTQFCQFIMSRAIKDILSGKGINIDNGKIIEIAKLYKEEQTRNNLKKITGLIR